MEEIPTICVEMAVFKPDFSAMPILVRANGNYLGDSDSQLCGGLHILYSRQEDFQGGEMKVLVISDIHLKPVIFDKADKILRAGKADIAIQMGDLVDDWGEEFNISLYSRTLRRAIKFQKDHPNTLWVMGNHDYGYWHANMGVRESGHSKFVEGEVLTLLNELERHGGKQKIMHIVDGCIFTHAGLTQSWGLRQLQLVGYDSSTKIPDNSTMSTIVNFASSSELWQENSPIWARPQIDDYVMYPAKLQIVGHTPVKTPEEKHGVLSTDTHSTFSNGAPFGDKSFVVVNTETGEWEKVTEDEYDEFE